MSSRMCPEELGQDAEEVAIEQVKEELLNADNPLELLEALCPTEFESLLWLAAEREYENRVEQALQDEADSQVVED